MLRTGKEDVAIPGIERRPGAYRRRNGVNLGSTPLAVHSFFYFPQVACESCFITWMQVRLSRKGVTAHGGPCRAFAV